MKETFITRSGVQIGLLYQTTAKPHHDADALKLQSAYLDGKPAMDWDGVLIVVVCAFLVASPYLIMAWRVA